MAILKKYKIDHRNIALTEIDDLLDKEISIFDHLITFKNLRSNSNYLENSFINQEIIAVLEDNNLVSIFNNGFTGRSSKSIFISNINLFSDKSRIIFEFGEYQPGRYILNQLAIIDE